MGGCFTGSGFRIQDLRFRVSVLGFRELGFQVWGLGFQEARNYSEDGPGHGGLGFKV